MFDPSLPPSLHRLALQDTGWNVVDGHSFVIRIYIIIQTNY